MLTATEDTFYALNPWWNGRRPDTGVPREEYLNSLAVSLQRPQINVLIGSRRIGKTTLLRQLVLRLIDEGTDPSDILYLALDHPRLVGSPLSAHLHAFRGVFGHARDRRLHLFLDEVQESPGWDAVLKAPAATENVKMVCSGSTAALVASQGGKLTGRQLVSTVHPLSFREFLSFRGVPVVRGESYRYERLVEEYLQVGGYPENVLDPSEEYLQNLLQDILARDLVRLYDVRRSGLLMDLLRLVAAGVGSRTSFSKLAKVLGLAVDTVRDYLGYFESAFLVRTLGKWTPSHTERVYASRKFYLADTGLKALLTGPGDLGAKAETAVFMHLLRKGEQTGYFAESEREVDFVLGDERAPRPLEVKYTDGLAPADRRLSGLQLLLRRHPATKAVRIVSRTQEATFELGGVSAEVTPLWRFLLEP